MNKGIQQIRGACHCGRVQLEVKLSDGLHSARRCTCSYCRMRGSVAVSAPVEGITIIAGLEALRTYEFNTNTAKHYFCSTCGIHTHHRRRSNPNECGVNVACLEGLSPFHFPEVPVNHGPTDVPGARRAAGVLLFIASDESSNVPN
jgi:hypothetical protein